MNHLYLRSLLFFANTSIYFGLCLFAINRYHAKVQYSSSREHTQDSFNGSSKSLELMDINENDANSQQYSSKHLKIENRIESYADQFEREGQKNGFSISNDIIEINTYWHTFSENGIEANNSETFISRNIGILNDAFTSILFGFNPCIDSLTHDESSLVKTPLGTRHLFTYRPSFINSGKGLESRRVTFFDLNIYADEFSTII